MSQTRGAFRWTTSVMSLLLLSMLIVISMTQMALAEKEVVTKKTEGRVEGPVIGIDLGTTYSCVAVYRNGKVEIIENELGSRITPSVVSWTANGERLTGEAAKNNAPFNPSNTLYDVKRLIGRRYREVLKKDAKLLSYDLTEKDGRVFTRVHVKEGTPPTVMSPEEVSAVVLQKMKQIAEKYLGEEIKHAVVTVPAYFNDQQRQATSDAGKIAGLEILRIVNEPTAASMAYGLYKEKEHNILVFDLGGGTFDVSLLTIDNGVFEVIATSGDTHLGGEDFDLRVVDHFSKMIKQKMGKEVRSNKRAFQRLKAEVEKAKRTLSHETEAIIEIESFLDGEDFSEKLTRAQFEKINMDLFQKTMLPVKQALKDSGLEKTDIDELVLVGGSTRIPKIQELLSKFFDGKKLNKEINPDEAVAYGAAVQAAVIAGTIDDRDIVLIDVIPLSLGIETQGGIMATIIPRNTPVPTEKSDSFTTTADFQERLYIPIYEGERKVSKYNRLLGELELTDIPPAPRGVPQIKVTFQLDQNGILKVIAQDQGTKNKRELTIQKGTLSKEEIERMQQDAEKNAEEDEKVLELSTARNRLFGLIESLRKQLRSDKLGEKIKSKDRKHLLSEISRTEKWLQSAKGENAEKKDYDLHINSLKRASGAVFSTLYGGDREAMDAIFGEEEDDLDTDDALRMDEDDEPINVPEDEDDQPIGKDEL